MQSSKSNSSVPAIMLEDVSFAYQAIPVLDHASVVIEQGESISIVGPNGGGKTTLLKLILGLLQPDEGTIQVLGQTAARARLKIGYMPQHTEHDLLFPVTVMDVVLTGCLGKPGLAGLLGWYGPTGRKTAIESLDRVGMADYRRRSFAALSGGQRQRVLIARALAGQPSLLLLDEPTANVDAAGETQLLEVLNNLKREMTIVMVSHDLGFVADLVRKVVCVNRQVRVHPTSQITGELIHDLYEQDVRMVQHDQHFSH